LYSRGLAFSSQKIFAVRFSNDHEIKALGLETCATLGMLDQEQAVALKSAGLDFYKSQFGYLSRLLFKIVTTRTYDDRLNTLKNAKAAGLIMFVVAL